MVFTELLFLFLSFTSLGLIKCKRVRKRKHIFTWLLTIKDFILSTRLLSNKLELNKENPITVLFLLIPPIHQKKFCTPTSGSLACCRCWFDIAKRERKNIWTCLEHDLQWVTRVQHHTLQISIILGILSDIALLSTSECLWFRCSTLTPEFIFMNQRNVFHHHSTLMSETEVLISSLFWMWWCPILSLQVRSQRWSDYTKPAAWSASIFMKMNI